MNDPAIRHAQRGERAAIDLAACAGWAAGHGLHLVLEHHVGSRFTFFDAHLPPATVDARNDDAVAIAIADPTALLVTAGGYYWGTPITGHRDWPTFAALPRAWAVLGVSALSGGYYGIHVHGAHDERFVGGVREETTGVEATIELTDGSRATVVRTTIGVRLAHGDRTVLCRDLGEALKAIERPVARLDASSYEASTLAALIEQAAVLPDDSVVLNNEVWHRTPALRPE
ncbi:MAG TPA: hypothetical protein VHP57_09215 [Acidimicrobiia bacterium]|nr:hypothetical protein [Acidimicrobiia bacterium]